MNTKEIYEKLNNDYLLKRNNAILFADKQTQLARADKTYASLEIEKRSLILDISKLSFQKKDSNKLQTKLDSVILAMNKRLIELKINEKSLSPIYECLVCNDTGKVDDNYCTCYRQAFNNLQMKEGNISLSNLPSLKNYNFDILDKQQQEQMQKLILMCEKLLKNYRSTKINNIVLSGKTGIGKTYFSQVLAKESILSGYTAYYTTAFNLNTQMRQYHTTFTEDKDKILENLLESDFLFIDDLGTEPIYKNVTKEYIQHILCERDFENKKTIITTNLGPSHLFERYDERVFSRILNKQNSLLIRIEGEDLRLKK